MMPNKCTVCRDGQEKKVEAHELVPGDLVRLCLGDRVPADIRIIETADLKVGFLSRTDVPEVGVREGGDAHRHTAQQLRNKPCADMTSTCGSRYRRHAGALTVTCGCRRRAAGVLPHMRLPRRLPLYATD